MTALHATRTAGLLLLVLTAASCEIATFGEGKGRGHGRWGDCNTDHDDDDDGHHGFPRRDGGVVRAPPADATVTPIDAGETAPAPDAGVIGAPDSGVAAAPDSGPTTPPDSGIHPDAEPECRVHTDCTGGRVCDQGTCVLPDCPDLTTEAACVARADCIPIYSGMNCTDREGGECMPGDANCTCATFAFAVCGRRPQ